MVQFCNLGGYMSNSKTLLKLSFIACLMLAFTIESHASDGDRITQLEKEVQELKLRLANLEAPQGGTSTTSKQAAPAKSWTALANWRALKQGMSYEEVRAALGEPERLDGGTFTRWLYPNQGRVVFYKDKLDSWSEPRER
jgi:hypothetical protein